MANGLRGQKKETSKKWAWDLIPSGEFAAMDCKVDWLIGSTLVAKQNGLIAGSFKTLKTTMAAELAVSLGTATPFLGDFPVYRKCRVGFISGESGKAAMKDMFLRICKSRGIQPASADVVWGFTLPSFADEGDMAIITRNVEKFGIDVLITDPAYLCVLRGLDPNDAKSMFAMGPHLARFSNAVIGGGGTPIIVHHANRGQKTGATMELSDIAYAGFAEYAAQWMLISRESPYKGDGLHALRLNVGGRAGQGGLYSLSIDEGIIDENGSGRKWEVSTSSMREVIEHVQEEREAEKQRKATEKADKRRQEDEVKQKEAKERKVKREREAQAEVERHAEQLYELLLKEPLTKTQIDLSTGWGSQKRNKALACLISTHRCGDTLVCRPTGQGGKASSMQSGFEAVKVRPVRPVRPDEDGEEKAWVTSDLKPFSETDA